jgi:hypothetical protein
MEVLIALVIGVVLLLSLGHRAEPELPPGVIVIVDGARSERGWGGALLALLVFGLIALALYGALR